MTSDQRAAAKKLKREILYALHADTREHDEARAAVLAKMLMAYPSAGVSADGTRARVEAYRDALDDLPAWAVSQAVKGWNRGKCGDHNYNFAPAPAILRRITETIIAPYNEALTKIEAVLNAQSIDEAMDSSYRPPIDPDAKVLPFAGALKRI